MSIYGTSEAPANYESPNLDGMDIGDLRRFVNQAVTQSQPLPPWQLREYASLKIIAMQYRERGRIMDAMDYENRCEKIYRHLPTNLRW